MTADPPEGSECLRADIVLRSSLDAASSKAIYEEALTAIDRQERNLAEARNQAGQAFGLGVLLGGLRSITEELGSQVSVAVVSLLLVSVGLAAFISWPRKWKWGTVLASEAFGDFGGLTEAEVYRQRALDLEQDYQDNKKPLARRQWALRWLLVDVVILVVVLVVTAT